MIIRTISFALVLATTAMSCQNDSATQSTPAGETSMTADSSASPAPGMEGQVQATSGAPMTMPEGMQQMQTAPTGAAGAAAAKLAPGTPNPAHGQPGHVCGVQVGTPLTEANMAAAKNAPSTQMTPSGMAPGSTPVTTSTGPNPIQVAPQGAPAAVAPGTNPPHGQPGHVCGTTVGAPLPKQ